MPSALSFPDTGHQKFSATASHKDAVRGRTRGSQAKMLSAEHFALEHEAVKQLLAIREQEVRQMCDHFNAIGTQSALIAGKHTPLKRSP